MRTRMGLPFGGDVGDDDVVSPMFGFWCRVQIAAYDHYFTQRNVIVCRAEKDDRSATKRSVCSFVIG